MSIVDTLEIGFEVSFSKIISEQNIFGFCEASGDNNALHLDSSCARQTVFGERIAPGILILGLVSAALASLPGIVVYVSQSAKFIQPVAVGDSICATAKILSKNAEKSRLVLETWCMNQHGEIVLSGTAEIKILEPKGDSSSKMRHET